MPKTKILSKAELNKQYPEKEYIESNIRDIRRIYLEMIEKSKQMEEQVLQGIYLFSIIDCLAQEYANYPVRHSKEAFCNFIIQFQGNTYTYLNEIEPITLYYDIEEKIDKVVKHPELVWKNPEIIKNRPELVEPKPEININEIGRIDECLVKDVIKNNNMAVRLLKYISGKESVSEKQFEKLKSNHTLLNLIYTRRSKLVHEMSNLGGEYSWEKEKGYAEPYYREMGRLYEAKGNIVYDNVFQLVIPNAFICDLATICINNYLDYCDDRKQYPFKNNMNYCRRVGLTWVDQSVF